MGCLIKLLDNFGGKFFSFLTVQNQQIVVMKLKAAWEDLEGGLLGFRPPQTRDFNYNNALLVL